MNGLVFWKDNLFLCIMAGLVWGLIAMLINSITGAATFELAFVHNLVTFAAGGVVFGLVAGGTYALAKDLLPCRPFLGAVVVSVGVWMLLASTGFVLNLMKPVRYHFDVSQTLQGLFLAIVLGVVLGIFWDKGGSRAAA